LHPKNASQWTAPVIPPVDIRFEQTAGFVRIGDLVPVVVRIDTHGQSINAAELHLAFSTVGLVVDHVSQEQSIFTIWAEQPAWNNTAGTITATAGRPNGIIASDASILTVYFRASASGAWDVSAAADTKFLLNDGSGTAIEGRPGKISINIVDTLVPTISLTSQSNPTPETWSRGKNVDVSWTLVPKAQYSFTFSSRADRDPDQIPEATDGHEVFATLDDGVYYFALSQVLEGTWSPIVRRRFLVDHTAPQEFSIVRLPGGQLDGRDAISWLANDATSGVAAVTVRVAGQTISNPTTPLRVQPLWYGEEVTVTLIDQAGNIRQAKTVLPGTPRISLWVIVGCVALAIVAGVTAWWAHRRHRRS
jgi:hypothetical protein